MKRFHALLFRSDLNATRLMLALGAIFIGLGFAWPTPIFPTPEMIAAGQGRHTYALMAQIAPEWAWSTAFMVQGSLMLWSLMANVRNRWLLWLDAALGVVIWTVAVGACYLAYWRGFANILDYRPPAIMGGEVAAVLAQWWVFVRYHFDDARTGQDRRSRGRRFSDG